MTRLTNRTVLLTGVFTIWGVAACGGESAPDTGESIASLSDDGYVYEDAEASFETDVRIAARDLALPVEMVRKSIEFQEEFANRAARTLKDGKDKIAAVWVDPVPATSAHIVFVGQIPAEANEFLGDPRVRVSGGASHSMLAQYAVVRHISEAARGMGCLDHAVYYVHQTQRIRLSCAPDAAGNLVDKDSLAAEVTRRLAETATREVPAQLDATDFDLEEKLEPSTPQATIGGEALQVSGSFHCTRATNGLKFT